MYVLVSLGPSLTECLNYSLRHIFHFFIHVGLVVTKALHLRVESVEALEC